jgi:hypothetical protein
MENTVESRWAISLCEFVTCLAEGGRFIHQKIMSCLVSCVMMREMFLGNFFCIGSRSEG